MNGHFITTVYHETLCYLHISIKFKMEYPKSKFTKTVDSLPQPKIETVKYTNNPLNYMTTNKKSQNHYNDNHSQ